MTEPAHADANILLVDDEPSIVRLLTRALQSAGYTSIQGYTDSVAALASLDSTLPDLIVLDINMPGMSGYDFLNDLSQQLTEDTFLPVLMVSGLSEAETRLQALQAGAQNFLTKPIDIKLFLAHVRSLLETRFMSLRLNEVRGVLEELVRRRTAQLQQAHPRSSTAWDGWPNIETTPPGSTPTGWDNCADSSPRNWGSPRIERPCSHAPLRCMTWAK